MVAVNLLPIYHSGDGGWMKHELQMTGGTSENNKRCSYCDIPHGERGTPWTCTERNYPIDYKDTYEEGVEILGILKGYLATRGRLGTVNGRIDALIIAICRHGTLSRSCEDGLNR